MPETFDPEPAIDHAKRPVAVGRVLLVTAAFIIVLAGLKAASGLILPILVAAFLATVSFPILDWLRRKRVPRALAVFITVLVDFAFIGLLILGGFSLVGDLQEKWDDKYRVLMSLKAEEAAQGITDLLVKFDVPDAEEKVNAYFDQKSLDSTLNELDGAAIWNWGTGLLGHVTKFLSTAFIIFVLTVFMLTEARMFGRRMKAINAARGPNFKRMMSAVHDIQRFLGIKTVISLVTGVLAGVVCWLADLDFPVLWGILAFALNYIPVVGSIIAGLPPVLLALIVHGGWTSLSVWMCYVGINIFLGNFIEPMLMGRRFGLSTLVVILAVLFWGWLWGPVGMFLAVPLVMMVKVGLDNSSDFRWLAVAISKEKPPGKASAVIEAARDKAIAVGTKVKPANVTNVDSPQ